MSLIYPQMYCKQNTVLVVFLKSGLASQPPYLSPHILILEVSFPLSLLIWLISNKLRLRCTLARDVCPQMQIQYILLYIAPISSSVSVWVCVCVNFVVVNFWALLISFREGSISSVTELLPLSSSSYPGTYYFCKNMKEIEIVIISSTLH